MGIPGQFDNPKFHAVMDRIKSISNNLNISVGIHIIEPDISELNNRIKEGYSLLAYSLDMRMLDSVSRKGVSNFKEKT